MTYGFQLVVVQSPTCRIVGTNGQSWVLPSPVGLVTVHGVPDTLKDATELTFRSVGFETEDDAREAGEVFRRWLQVASALGSYAFDFGASRHGCGSIQGSESRRRSCGRTCSIGPSVSMMRPSAALAEWKP